MSTDNNDSYLLRQVTKAQTFLDRTTQTPTASATDAVVHDGFDAAMFRELLDEAPALYELAYEDLGKTYDYTEDLVRDVLMEFWKADPTVRSPKEMYPSFLLNQAVADDMSKAPETPQTRAFTKHDRYGSAMATIAVTNKIKSSLDKAKEAQAAAEAAAKAEAELRQRIKDLLEAMPDLSGMSMGVDAEGNPVPGDGEAMAFGLPIGAEGPLTEGDAEAFDALVAALQAAQDADLSYEDTLAEAQDQIDQVGRKMAPQVREAIEEAGDMLAEEADLMSSWGVDDGLLKRLSFSERQRLAGALRCNRLHEFRKLLGRFKIMQAAQSAKKVEFARDEAYDVELSDRLPDVLAGEWARIANPHSRLEFLEDLAEGRLLSKKYRGLEKIGQGSIIALVDNSGSMEARAAGDHTSSGPTREAYAKAFALALLDQAREAGRDFVGINFSSAGQVSVFRFPKGKGDIYEVMRFVEEFYGGGTDYMTPMNLAMDILEAEFNAAGLIKADLCMITDDDCRVTPTWLASYKERKERLGFRTFGIAVGCHAGNALASLSDNVRSIHSFTDPMAVADIIRTI